MALDSTLSRRDALMPQRPGGLGRGTALAVLAHVGLVIALAFGVSWRSQEPAGVSAELWAAVPQAAAPAAVEPTPAPKPPPAPKVAEPPPKPSPTEAQIAIEKEKADRLRKEKEQQEHDRKERERLEREKAEKLALQQKRASEAEAKRQKEEDLRQAKQREDMRVANLKRAMGEAGGTGAPTSTGTAAREAGPSASYTGRIIARIKPNIVLTDDVPGNPTAEVEVRCAADGTIVGRRLVKSSGQKAWDEAVLRAIDRTEILPRDTDGRLPGTMVIAFRPQE